MRSFQVYSIYPRVLAIGLFLSTLLLSPSATADNAAPPKISKTTREEIIHAFSEDLVYIRAKFPMGKTGLRLKNGTITPTGPELDHLVALWGPAAKPGDRARISDVVIKDDHIRFEINGARHDLVADHETRRAADVERLGELQIGLQRTVDLRRGHVALQLAFLLAAPEIGYVFLGVLFLIFGFGALRMTSRQAIIAWTLTMMGLAPIFLITPTPIGMPFATDIERFAAILCYVVTIGQCAFVGLYGSSLRTMLYNRSFELKQANTRIEQLAELDELTGSLNRRSIMRTLNGEISRAHRSKAPCSIALIDLDWFKRINDTYGHPTGDEVLRTFAISVYANIRDFDRFGRFGGEEFLLVLPDTADATAVRILDRLRAIIADLDWSAFSPGMRVTVSAGVASLRPDETADTFLARADRALYAAKARGRNRIASA